MIEWAPQEEATGVDHGVLYLAEGAFPWNGLVSTTEHADESVIQTDLYFDGNRFGFVQTPDDFSLGVAAWSYPREFEIYEGLTDDLVDRQPRRAFGFSYREGNNLHLVWNVTSTPTESIHSSMNNEFEITQFTWELVSAKTMVSGAAPTSHVVIDLSKAVPEAVSDLEDLLYGTISSDPSWPTPQEVIDIFLTYPILVITDHGDGRWTASGPDDVVWMEDLDRFKIKWPSARYKSSILYQVSSM